MMNYKKMLIDTHLDAINNAIEALEELGIQIRDNDNEDWKLRNVMFSNWIDDAVFYSKEAEESEDADNEE